MELSARLLRWGAARPHLLVAEVAGGTGVRLAVERCLRSRRWPPATGPSDADVLVVCGAPHATVQEALETTWRAMPGPRTRIQLGAVDDVPAQLTLAVTRLADRQAQRAEARQRPVGVPDDPTPERKAEEGQPTDAGDHHEGMSDDGGQADSGPVDGGMDHGDMQMDMDMSLPGGLVLADRADDRDGLKLDVLHLRLGPFLPSWPAGLLLDIALQGDVVQEASVDICSPSDADSFWAGPPGQDFGRIARLLAAAHLDSSGRLLQLAGWVAAADEAGRLRDDTLAGAAVPSLQAQLHRLRVRASRSWSLRWGLRDLGVLRAGDAERLGVTGPAARADGDVLDRLLQWLLEAEQALDGDCPSGEGPRGRLVQGRAPSAALLAAVPALVTGLDVAGARLVIASLDPDVAELVPAVPGG